jgi:hypothetical protein
VRAAALAAATLLLAVPARGDAVGDIAKQLDTHSVVMVGELHRSLQIHTFLQQMLRDPRFVCRVDDVAVEFGNSRLQPLADTYASGGTLSETQVASM